jgi:hypothetical protein
MVKLSKTSLMLKISFIGISCRSVVPSTIAAKISVLGYGVKMFHNGAYDDGNELYLKELENSQSVNTIVNTDVNTSTGLKNFYNGII